MIRVTGSVTFQSEWDGAEIAVRVEPFDVLNDSSWIEIVDEATERNYPAGSAGPEGYGWMQIDEHLNEALV